MSTNLFREFAAIACRSWAAKSRVHSSHARPSKRSMMSWAQGGHPSAELLTFSDAAGRLFTTKKLNTPWHPASMLAVPRFSVAPDEMSERCERGSGARAGSIVLLTVIDGVGRSIVLATDTTGAGTS